ncbi:MAG: hypothetical protein PVS3B3_17870 [Ktedonobacteraceae bacterium]
MSVGVSFDYTLWAMTLFTEVMKRCICPANRVVCQQGVMNETSTETTSTKQALYRLKLFKRLMAVVTVAYGATWGGAEQVV